MGINGRNIYWNVGGPNPNIVVLYDLDFDQQHKRSVDISDGKYLLTQPHLNADDSTKYPILDLALVQNVLNCGICCPTGSTGSVWCSDVELTGSDAESWIQDITDSKMVNVFTEVLAMEYSNQSSVSTVRSEQAPSVDGGTFNLLTD